jgi:D-lactate dehydrogenase
LVALRSAGYNNVDLPAADQLKITLMSCSRLRAGRHRRVRRGADADTEPPHPPSLQPGARGQFRSQQPGRVQYVSKTVGIVGTGKIDTALTHIMKGFGCELLGYDVYHNPTCIELGLRYTDLPTLLAQSDIISIHCPLTPETKHLVNEETIQLMKPGSMLINTARGAIVDASAVIEKL